MNVRNVEKLSRKTVFGSGCSRDGMLLVCNAPNAIRPPVYSKTHNYRPILNLGHRSAELYLVPTVSPTWPPILFHQMRSKSPTSFVALTDSAIASADLRPSLALNSSPFY